MTKTGQFILIVLVAFLFVVSAANGEPNWTKTGDCRTCHAIDVAGALQVTGFYTQANPAGHGRQKVVWIKPGETKSLTALVPVLASGDRYDIVLKKLASTTGLTSGLALQYEADCNWAQWWSGASMFFTNPPLFDNPVSHYLWPIGPSLFEYTLTIAASCPADYYDLAFGIGGSPAHGTGFFYHEEHFYLYVGLTPPPSVMSADFDADGDVDQEDFGALQRCYADSGTAPLPGCADTDLDGDGDVDNGDLEIFEQCAGGPGLPPSVNCPN